MKIAFFYKGRYFLQDALVTETLSAIARGYGHETALIYDQDSFGLSDNIISSPRLHKIFSRPQKSIKKIITLNPDLVVFYDAIHLNKPGIEGFAEGIKTSLPGVKTVYLSVIDLPAPCGVDFTLIGEPELAFDVFLRERYDTGAPVVFRIPGVVDVNKLPLPDKSLFERYVNFRDSYMVFTSKGCPAHCSYCLETVLKDTLGAHYCRRRLPEHVIAELQEAQKRYRMREVIFKDPIFALNKDWLRQFLAQYRKQIGLPYKCFAKAGSFDEEMAGMLKESRCYCVEFGVQTLNESLKRRVLSREEHNAVVAKAFALCDRHHLAYDADHLFGIPGESLDDHITAAGIYANLRGLNRIKCHNLVFYRQAKIFEWAPADIKNDDRYQSDFFSAVAGSPDMKIPNACFQKYFKILPLFSPAVNSFLRHKNRWKFFRFVPNVLIMAGMLVLAMKNQDKRFYFYLKYYPKTILKTVLGV